MTTVGKLLVVGGGELACEVSEPFRRGREVVAKSRSAALAGRTSARSLRSAVCLQGATARNVRLWITSSRRRATLCASRVFAKESENQPCSLLSTQPRHAFAAN